jgi:hypothetical protein
MKETKEILHLLHRYFNGESSNKDEQVLRNYFESGEVADELKEYASFFAGISELHTPNSNQEWEEEIMDYILETEHKDRTRYFSMWKTVTGIAASIIIVLGGFLFYQEREKTYDDSFQNPQEAYAYAELTLQYISGKYSKGLEELSNFEKLRKANTPVKKGTAKVVEFYQNIEELGNEKTTNIKTDTDSL